jgi:hypothetical protein
MYTRFFRWASDRLHDDGILAFITNRSFIYGRTMDGFPTQTSAPHDNGSGQKFSPLRLFSPNRRDCAVLLFALVRRSD